MLQNKTSFLVRGTFSGIIKQSRMNSPCHPGYHQGVPTYLPADLTVSQSLSPHINDVYCLSIKQGTLRLGSFVAIHDFKTIKTLRLGFGMNLGMDKTVKIYFISLQHGLD